MKGKESKQAHQGSKIWRKAYALLLALSAYVTTDRLIYTLQYTPPERRLGAILFLAGCYGLLAFGFLQLRYDLIGRYARYIYRERRERFQEDQEESPEKSRHKEK